MNYDISMLSNFASDQTVRLYRPAIKLITRQTNATLFLGQVMYRWFGNGRKPFYKFNNPCDHKLCKLGDSWCEELIMTEDEFTTARDKVATKSKGEPDYQIINGYPNPLLVNEMIYYWTDRADNLTWYSVNELLAEALLRWAYGVPFNELYSAYMMRQKVIIMNMENAIKIYLEGEPDQEKSDQRSGNPRSLSTKNTTNTKYTLFFTKVQNNVIAANAGDMRGAMSNDFIAKERDSAVPPVVNQGLGATSHNVIGSKRGRKPAYKLTDCDFEVLRLLQEQSTANIYELTALKDVTLHSLTQLLDNQYINAINDPMGVVYALAVKGDKALGKHATGYKLTDKDIEILRFVELHTSGEIKQVMNVQDNFARDEVDYLLIADYLDVDYSQSPIELYQLTDAGRKALAKVTPKPKSDKQLENNRRADIAIAYGTWTGGEMNMGALKNVTKPLADNFPDLTGEQLTAFFATCNKEYKLKRIAPIMTDLMIWQAKQQAKNTLKADAPTEWITE